MEWALILILQNGTVWDSELRYPNVYECQKARNEAGTNILSAKPMHEVDNFHMPLGLTETDSKMKFIGQYKDDLETLKSMRCLPSSE
jgi:hypothetical protein